MASPVELHRTKGWRYRLALSKFELSRHPAWQEAAEQKPSTELTQTTEFPGAEMLPVALLGQVVYEQKS